MLSVVGADWRLERLSSNAWRPTALVRTGLLRAVTLLSTDTDTVIIEILHREMESRYTFHLTFRMKNIKVH